MGKTKQLSVPSDAFFEFAQLVGENSVRATIAGTDDDDTVKVVLEYEPDERATVHYLEDFVEDRWLEIEVKKENDHN